MWRPRKLRLCPIMIFLTISPTLQWNTEIWLNRMWHFQQWTEYGVLGRTGAHAAPPVDPEVDYASGLAISRRHLPAGDCAMENQRNENNAVNMIAFFQVTREQVRCAFVEMRDSFVYQIHPGDWKDSSVAIYYIFTHSPCTTLRDHQQKLELPLCNNNTSKYFFSSRVIKPWNSLAAELISIQNPKLFKKRLNQINLSDFLTIPYCNHKQMLTSDVRNLQSLSIQLN